MTDRCTHLGEVDRKLNWLLAECSEPNWNSYSASPLTVKAVEAARAMLATLTIVPTNSGGIEVSFLGEEISIEFNAEGRIDNTFVCPPDAEKQIAAVRAHWGDDEVPPPSEPAPSDNGRGTGS